MNLTVRPPVNRHGRSSSSNVEQHPIPCHSAGSRLEDFARKLHQNLEIESPGISVFPAKLEVFQLMTNDNLREYSQNKVLLNCYFATLIFFCNFCSQRFSRNLAQ